MDSHSHGCPINNADDLARCDCDAEDIRRYHGRDSPQWISARESFVPSLFWLRRAGKLSLQTVRSMLHYPLNRSLTIQHNFGMQFDIQQPELTVRETVEFCARLRLDAKDPMIQNDDGKRKFAAHVLKIMELTNIQNLQVGSFSEGGLTFEQRKRLSIACELAGSPSVIFLDGKRRCFEAIMLLISSYQF